MTVERSLAAQGSASVASRVFLSLVVCSLLPLGAVAGRLRRHEKHRAVFRQTLQNYRNSQYYGNIIIGGQTLPCIFDTGSFDLLVRSSLCSHCSHPTPPYDRRLSDTYIENGTEARHEFQSGFCSAVMGYESVSVGDQFQTKRQAFWEITKHKIDIMDTSKFAAIVGIGPNFAYHNEEKTLLRNFDVDEFSICLQKKHGSEGFLTWGKTPTDLVAEDYAEAKVIGDHHWVAALQNVTFIEPSGHLAQIPCGDSTGCSAIIDSGTSLIAAPGLALAQLSQQIPRIAEDCSNIHLLPTLRLVLGGHQLELPPQAYVMRVVGTTLEADSIWDLLWFKPKIRKLDSCIPAFMQIDMRSEFGPVWILGMPFLRYYHTTFDRKNKAMRFAVAGPSCQPRPYRANRAKSLLGVDAFDEDVALNVEIGALVPPTLFELNNDPSSVKSLVL